MAAPAQAAGFFLHSAHDEWKELPMQPDVLVIGGGNAALCAALMAREAGASVLLLESAPRDWRGGCRTK